MLNEGSLRIAAGILLLCLGRSAPDARGCGSSTGECPSVQGLIARLHQSSAADVADELASKGPCIIPQLAEACAESVAKGDTDVISVSDDEAWFRQEIEGVLEDLGPKAAPQLAELLRRRHACREQALRALCRIGPEVAELGRPEVIAALDDEDVLVRAAAALQVGLLGWKGAVPQLTRRLRDPSELVRENAAAALGQLGSASRGATGALIETLLNEANSRALRIAVVEALVGIGSATEDVMVALKEAATRHDELIRLAANDALVKLQRGRVPEAP